MQFKLGKTPARPGAVKLHLSTYLRKLPKVPASFGHERDVTTWGMLGNDDYGDCVWAGAAHETIIWNHEAGRPVTFDTANVLGDYSAVTGFNAADPATDNGTDMEIAAKYRRTTGILDAAGKRHVIGAYLALTPGDLKQTLAAAYLFGAVGIGIRFPESAMRQFNKGQAWTVVKGSNVDGGHYIPLVAHRGSSLYVVTWGKLQRVTPAFFERYCDEAICYLSEECLGPTGCTPEGFNLAQLKDDLAEITK